MVAQLINFHLNTVDSSGLSCTRDLTSMSQMEVGCPGAWWLVLPTQTQVEHPISQPYPQPSHEPPSQTEPQSEHLSH